MRGRLTFSEDNRIFWIEGNKFVQKFIWLHDKTPIGIFSVKWFEIQ